MKDIYRDSFKTLARGFIIKGHPVSCLIKSTLVMLLLILSSHLSMANNIIVTNLSTTGVNMIDDFIMVKFDVAWDNSWRTSSAPDNRDAAWVFAKFKVTGNFVSSAGATSSGTTITVASTTGLRVGMPLSVTAGTGVFAAGTIVSSITNATTFVVSAAPTTALSGGASVVTGTAFWEHASLNSTGHSAATGSVITPAADGTGAFIYRSADGSGTSTFTNTQLRWNYGVNGVNDGATVDIRVFGLEMVYVPTGAFTVGSGGQELGSFTNGSWVSGNTTPLLISSENALTIAHTSGNMWGTTSTGNSSIGPAGTLEASYPKGYNGFYCMKYEISQQDYVEFLNSLTQSQATERKLNSTGNRLNITGSTVGSYVTTTPYVAMNYLCWSDVAAYLDWSGLRPMSELEFEKSCRGTLTPVANEYAWGSIVITQNTGITNSGLTSEISTNGGNCTYGNHASVNGPMRVGAFATSVSTRVTSGATYYGIMEMSGNLWEFPVSIGNIAGRSYTGVHGDGLLNSKGEATVDFWPGINGNATLTTANTIYLGVTGVAYLKGAGIGLRGNGWLDVNSYSRVSDRRDAGAGYNFRGGGYGGRGVRSAP